MGALDVSKGTVKSIYALGAKLGMVERGGGHADALHALVQGLTGKESITALTPAEAQAVLAELRRRSAPVAAPQKKRPRKYEAMPGGLSEGQQKKVWYLMYQLEKYDPAGQAVRADQQAVRRDSLPHPAVPVSVIFAGQCTDRRAEKSG